jgi:hypothetical protein
VPAALALLAGGALGLLSLAPAAKAQENPPVMLQWFETRWVDMERRIPDWFEAGYGAVWLPPVSRGYHPPFLANQNSTSAGYDVFDRFDLGKPGAETAFGTEQSFSRVREELQLAGGLVYIDMVLNHNAGRRTDAGFMNDGGYPGFWMNPPAPMRDKLPTDDWGDFHGGNAQGYRQSEAPQSPNYCLLAGDLVALVDIDHGRSNLYIRQPVVQGHPQNIPSGLYFNRVDPNNARFYPDSALGTQTITTPGMTTSAGELSSSPFGPFPCNVPSRNEGPTSLTVGRFNLANPMAGDAQLENANDYLIRWTQWMLDVQKVDGFRIDAIKHMPSWFYDNLYDAVVSNRRVTPDGRLVTPYSFGECVEGNDFCFDRYVRMPNGRGSGRSGDSFGNRDVLDLAGAGYLRGVARGEPWANFFGVLNSHIDATDDGFNNGTVGVNHIFSHDNGSNGDGNTLPGVPQDSWQGWFMHAYLTMRPGQAKLYHHGRGIARTGTAFYPREGLPVALGLDPTTNQPNSVITNLVQLSNWFGRGELAPRWTDDFVFIFDRRTNTGGGTYSSNVLVGIGRSYAGNGITSFDSRTVATNFPPGTRLIEYTGNSARADVDPNNQIPDVITVGANGNVEIRVPRNQNVNGLTHNRGFVVYAPAIPSGTLSFSPVASTIAADPATPLPFNPASTANARRRLTSLPVITANSFDVQLITTNGDVAGGSNANADDNAVFRFNQGYQDLNGNGIVDIDYTNGVVPGYEQFVTQRQPLFGQSNVNGTGIYRQTINAALLPEGVNYVSVVAFRKRVGTEGPIFRDFRKAIYIDRLPPAVTFNNPGLLPEGTAQLEVRVTPDRTVNRVHIIANPPSVANPVTLANILTNQATRRDRLDWRRTVSGLQPGDNTILVISFEESGRSNAQFFTVTVDQPAPPCLADFDQDGGITGADVEAFFLAFENGESSADTDGDGGITGADVEAFFFAFESGC